MEIEKALPYLTDEEFLELALKENEFPITVGRPPDPASFSPGDLADVIENIAQSKVVELAPRPSENRSGRVVPKSA